MIVQNLRFATRNILKNKLFATISLLSLVIGWMVFLFTMHYRIIEKSYDSFFEGADRIYRVNVNVKKISDAVERSAVSSLGMYYDLKNSFPGIEANTCTYFEPCLIRYQREYLSNQRVLWVEENFEKVFRFEMIAGKASFERPLIGVISESKAKKLFKSENPIGQTIKVNEGMPMLITGVCKDFPTNTHLEADFFFAMKTFVHYGWMPNHTDNWDGLFVWNYIKIKQGIDPHFVEDKINSFAEKRIDFLRNQGKTARFEIQNLSDLHFSKGLARETGSSSTKRMLLIITIIGIITLVVAFSNFINLHAAQLYGRGHEISIRKVLGASPLSLFLQLLTESLIINTIAILLAYILYSLTLPLFSVYFHIDFSHTSIPNFSLAKVISLFWLGGLLVCTILSFLSSLQFYISDAKKTIKDFGSFKKRFLVIQLAVAIGFILATIVVAKQLAFMQATSLGFNPVNVIVVNSPASTNSYGPDRRAKYYAFREEMMQMPNLESITATQNIPGEEPRIRDAKLIRTDEDIRPDKPFTQLWVDGGFLKTYGVKLIAGRDFSTEIIKDTSTFIINRKACNLLGFNTPAEALGKKVQYHNNHRFEIIGVVEDFHNEGLQKDIYPLTLEHLHPSDFGYYSFRLKSNLSPEIISDMREIWIRHFPEDPFIWFSEDEFFNKQYVNEYRLGRLLVLFTSIAIFIASMGVYGLILFYTSQKHKEIGIRRVNGANIFQIVVMLNRSFVILALVAFVIACPLSYYLINRWLQNFALRTIIEWWVFALSGSIVLIITLITVSWQSLRAAKVNPVDSLRSE